MLEIAIQIYRLIFDLQKVYEQGGCVDTLRTTKITSTFSKAILTAIGRKE
jgi:hypothetical protein